MVYNLLRLNSRSNEFLRQQSRNLGGTCVKYKIKKYNTLRFLKKIRESYTSLTSWVECSAVVRETEVQSQVESYQRLKNGT